MAKGHVTLHVMYKIGKYLVIIIVMDRAGVIKDDNIANCVLRDMHKELIEQINVEEVTLNLVSTGMITDAHREVLHNERRGVMDRAKYLLSREVLGRKGFMGLKALLESLKGNALYKPHLELANKIEESYLLLVRQSQAMSTGGTGAARQPTKRRVSESLSTTSTSHPQEAMVTSVQQSEPHYSLQFNTPGEYHVKLDHPVEHVSTSNLQPRSLSPVNNNMATVIRNVMYLLL